MIESGLLLDTHVAIWLVDGLVDPSALEVIERAEHGDGVFISPVSAWEIGLLARPRPPRPGRMDFKPDPQSWWERLISMRAFRLAPFTPRIALAASALPGVLHGDPADRMLAATARDMNMPIMTRDSKLIAYGREGYLKVIPC